MATLKKQKFIQAQIDAAGGPKSAAERKAAQRARQKAAGLVKVEAFVRPEQRARLVKYIARLNKESV